MLVDRVGVKLARGLGWFDQEGGDGDCMHLLRLYGKITRFFFDLTA